MLRRAGVRPVDLFLAGELLRALLAFFARAVLLVALRRADVLLAVLLAAGRARGLPLARLRVDLRPTRPLLEDLRATDLVGRRVERLRCGMMVTPTNLQKPVAEPDGGRVPRPLNEKRGASTGARFLLSDVSAQLRGAFSKNVRKDSPQECLRRN